MDPARRNRAKTVFQKFAKNLVKTEQNKQNSSQKPKLERRYSWQKLIRDVVDSQRGKIPLLLAVEAGNQSMCRELLSSQTAEQLKVSMKVFFLNISM